MEPIMNDPPTCPPKSQLAFALALLKQKPTGKEIKEHILEIRHHIKAARGSDFLSQEKFFDSVAFWQRAYKVSEAEQAKLLDKIHELEQRNQGLLDRLHVDSAKNDGSRVSKRPSTHGVVMKGTSADSAKTREKTRRSKVSKIQASGKSGNDESNSANFMRQLFALQHVLQKRHKNSSLATEAVVLCKEAEHALLQTVQQVTATSTSDSSSNRNSEPDLIAAIKSVEMSFSLVHRALQKLQNSENCEVYKSQIVYYLVCLFDSSMTALAQYCAHVSTHDRTSHSKTPLTTTTARGRKPDKSRYGQPHPNVTSKIAESLTNLLCTMTLSLDLTRLEDEKVMEGILFTTLSRVGSILALFTFKDLQLPTVCAELTPPAGLVSMSHETLLPEAIQLEAKQLIMFLGAVLSETSTSPLDIGVSRSHFLRKIKDRLQGTLLQKVFGNDDPTFQQALQPPATPPPHHRAPDPLGQTEFPEWFTQELWRLIGWDLLCTMAGGG